MGFYSFNLKILAIVTEKTFGGIVNQSVFMNWYVRIKSSLTQHL